MSGPRKRDPDERVFLYVIEEVGGPFCKVGISASPKSRFDAIQSSNPRPLRLAWAEESEVRDVAVSIEKDAHAILAHCRVRGEWFNCTADEAEFAITRAWCL